ncbi:dUTP diphosphatase [Alkaliphilus peptidifermentans]|uniref:Dimeric dUTPase, all-alpha-NTP-PPase (MazG) superfamily n=1 Tax=Alkaliphilus peptidifermentans DSM 18978 TaxID=1120976 RepID=A0A1G5FJT0_9FIRM|nr:dUTP diphosphatase [Alkaliphilus peptidifermentans]SCY39473.1 Dimeric dUTPase, all-alpha-NTP-PPase (MazG) superfamily [Alkaliphilus peptidifermentans DSM 18978]
MMNIEKLFQIQKELDMKILKEHQLEGKDLVPRKILALLVELGELANETRCFKYWSLKSPAEKKVILEEYVDCLHFILSIGLEKGFLYLSFEEINAPETVTGQFMEVFANITALQFNQREENYTKLWKSFVKLGVGLGFDYKEIEESYLMKNKINHQRQAEGY